MTTPEIPRTVWRAGIVTALGSVLSALDITVVNIAVDPIAHDFHADLPSVSWVLTGYLLAMAVVIPTSGWLSRHFGLYRTYFWALAAFVAASLLCALAPSLGGLVAARVLQGAAGAVLAPVGQMVVVSVTPRAALGHVMAVLTVPVLVAPILGPVLGGLLIDAFGWPSVFLVNLPVGAVALVAAVRMLPRDVPVGGGRLDLLGLALAGPGLAGVLFGLGEGGNQGTLADAHVVVPCALGAVLLVAFAAHAARHPSPLLDLRLLHHPVYRAATLTASVASVLTLGSILLMPLYFQGPRGESTTATAMLTCTTAVGVMVALRWAGRTADRRGTGPVALLGVAVLTVATIPLLGLDQQSAYPVLLVVFFVRGLGVAMLTGPVTAAAMRALPPESVADASVQVNVVARVGGSVGTALFVVLLQHRFADVGPEHAAEAFGWVHRWVLLVSVLVAVPALALLRAERRAAPPSTAVPLLPAEA